jgi:NTP pyrophosphatase (non-canonical NTP hydrolase)
MEVEMSVSSSCCGLTLNGYAEEAGKTAIYPRRGDNLYYPTLKLAGESGEVAEKVGKMDRDDGGVLTSERRDALRKEVGDVLWYCAALAYELDTTLEDIAYMNLGKLSKRAKEGKLHGDGDDR